MGAIGDASDAAFQPPRVGRIAVLEGGGLHPRGVEIFHLVTGDDAAAKTADAGEILRTRDVTCLRAGGRWHVARQCDQEDERGEYFMWKRHCKSLWWWQSMRRDLGSIGMPAPAPEPCTGRLSEIVTVGDTSGAWPLRPRSAGPRTVVQDLL